MFSIVCVYNNRLILNEWLLASIDAQTIDFELVLIDNTNNQYKSAAEALNRGAQEATGDYILFSHQDVRLIGTDWLQKAESLLESLDNLGIAGVAGVSSAKQGEESFRNQILENENPTIPWGNQISTVEKVQTVDECLFIIPRHIYKKLKFDEKICINWHFYSVDYCLMCLIEQLEVYVIPLRIHHRSRGFSKKLFSGVGSLNYLRDYYLSLSNLQNKYKRIVKEIRTTNGSYRTAYPGWVQDALRIPLRSIRKAVVGARADND